MNDLHNTMSIEVGQDAAPLKMESVFDDTATSSEEAPEPLMVETDEEAECLLPGYSIAFEEYHQHRASGASPDEALQMTMARWRALWNAVAYVPHRRN